MPVRPQKQESSKYKLILSDPAWRQSKGGKKSSRPNSSGGALDYTTLTLEQIENIQRKAMEMAEDDHILFLWTIDKYLPEAEKMLERLGYKLHARMIWNKVTGIPSAFTVRYGHEYLLYCYKGKLLPVAPEMRGKIHTVFTEKVQKHSQKPIISYEIIESLYPRVKRLEMYCRGTGRPKWDVWGYEAVNPIEL